jgi:hypothetical protein
MKNPTILTISEYIKKKDDFINNHTFIIEAGTGIGYYLVKGERVLASEFEKEHKVVVMSLFSFNSKSADPRRDWLSSKK